MVGILPSSTLRTFRGGTSLKKSPCIYLAHLFTLAFPRWRWNAHWRGSTPPPPTGQTGSPPQLQHVARNLTLLPASPYVERVTKLCILLKLLKYTEENTLQNIGKKLILSFVRTGNLRHFYFLEIHLAKCLTNSYQIYLECSLALLAVVAILAFPLISNSMVLLLAPQSSAHI